MDQLKKIAVLIVEPDIRLAGLMRQVLSSIGFGTIHAASDGSEALETAARAKIDLMITDWTMTPMDGIALVQAVRRSTGNPSPKLPVLMLTGRGKRLDVQYARDCGIDEFLIRPFTVRGLCDRIGLMIDHPRDFVASADFTGPDRRRRGLPPDGKEKRGRPKPKQPSKSLPKTLRTDETTIIAADRELREKIGPVPIAELFSPQKVERAQAMITAAQEDYLAWVKDDLSALSAALTAIEKDPGHLPASIDAFQDAAIKVKGQAGIFGYTLATEVADSMSDLAEGVDRLSRTRTVAARKHLDALYIIFHERMMGDGGPTGAELKRSLAALSRFVT